MIARLSGKIILKDLKSCIVETAGIGFRVSLTGRSLKAMPSEAADVTLFIHTHIKEDGAELYGFLNEDELSFFELLISVSGVGPKSALSILEVSDLESLSAAIKEGRPDLLTKASGVGRKTAERLIVELKEKMVIKGSGKLVKGMDSDADILESLTNLGYRREEVRNALQKIPKEVTVLEARLKAALSILSGRSS